MLGRTAPSSEPQELELIALSIQPSKAARFCVLVNWFLLSWREGDCRDSPAWTFELVQLLEAARLLVIASATASCCRILALSWATLPAAGSSAWFKRLKAILFQGFANFFQRACLVKITPCSVSSVKTSWNLRSGIPQSQAQSTVVCIGNRPNQSPQMAEISAACGVSPLHFSSAATSKHSSFDLWPLARPWVAYWFLLIAPFLIAAFLPALKQQRTAPKALLLRLPAASWAWGRSRSAISSSSFSWRLSKSCWDSCRLAVDSKPVQRLPASPLLPQIMNLNRL